MSARKEMCVFSFPLFLFIPYKGTSIVEIVVSSD